MANAIDTAFQRIFTNGKGQAGLEIGADPGLPAKDFIQIPDCMAKAWAIRFADEDWADYANKPDGAPIVPPAWNEGERPSDFHSRPGWVGSGTVYSSGGSLELKVGDEWFGASEFHIDPHTIDDVRAFVTVNMGHISDESFDEDTKKWIHACRFWAVASGFVTTSKSFEYTRVPDPATIASDDEIADIVQYIVDFRDNAWTASAARASSWRKTNHATGGDVLSGFPLRWARKMGFVRTLPDKAQAAAHMRTLTRAFYIATHASSVHAVLALLGHADDNAWVELDPTYGFIPEWEIMTSVQVRMIPNTQVAGGALVADSMTVLRMTIQEGIAPLIGALDQLTALKSAHAELEANGVRCAVYAKWFLDGHHDDIEPIAFNQKSPAFADLVGELAVIATHYYPTSTIAASAALRNAAEQYTDEDAKATWSAIAAQRKRVSGAQAVAAVARIKGAAATGVVVKLLAPDADTIRDGVADYNAALAGLANAVGGVRAPTINADQIVANAGLAAAVPTA